MIPKILHYCWLSDAPIPKNLQTYIDRWQKIMPDYQIKRWDKRIFDIYSVKWVEDAYNNKKWAFAADYIRAYALYSEGGFYLDSDVLVLKRFDNFLSCGFVTSIEYDHAVKKETEECLDENYCRKATALFVKGLGIQAAVMGSEKGHPFLKKILKHYETHSFINPDGSFDQSVAPLIYAKCLENWGFRYVDKLQLLSDNMKIYPSYIFAGYQTVRFSSYAVHMCAGSWLDKKGNKSFIANLKKVLLIRKIFNLLHIKN